MTTILGIIQAFSVENARISEKGERLQWNNKNRAIERVVNWECFYYEFRIIKNKVGEGGLF